MRDAKQMLLLNCLCNINAVYTLINVRLQCQLCQNIRSYHLSSTRWTIQIEINVHRHSITLLEHDFQRRLKPADNNLYQSITWWVVCLYWSWHNLQVVWQKKKKKCAQLVTCHDEQHKMGCAIIWCQICVCKSHDQQVWAYFRGYGNKDSFEWFWSVRILKPANISGYIPSMVSLLFGPKGDTLEHRSRTIQFRSSETLI